MKDQIEWGVSHWIFLRGSDMDVEAPKSLNNIESSKICTVQNPIQEKK